MPALASALTAGKMGDWMCVPAPRYVAKLASIAPATPRSAQSGDIPKDVTEYVLVIAVSVGRNLHTPIVVQSLNRED